MDQMKKMELQIFVLLLCLTIASCYQLSGIDLGVKLNHVAEEALGGDVIEKGMEKEATFTTRVPDGDAIVQNMAEQLGERFDSYNQAVIALRDKVEQVYVDFSSTPVDKECCKLESKALSYDDIFRKPVNKINLCFRLSATTKREGNTLEYAPKSLTDTMRKNAENIPNLGWQYYGTEQGIQHIYPQSNATSCTHYDPRQRPWYAEANAPIAKDIIIVFDFTKYEGSQENLEAIKLILKTTNPNDRLAMVAVGNPTPRTPVSGCYASQLALATPKNKNIFLNFTRDSSSYGAVPQGSDYKQAFRRAFDYFENGDRKEKQESKRQKLLIFMTDTDSRGASTLESILDFVRKQNEVKTNNTVVIQTYSFGSNINMETKAFLTSLANQTEFVTSSGIHKRGKYIHVESEKEVRIQLTSYYNAFAASGTVITPVVTAPYEDFSGLGTVISLCLPVHYPKNKLKGVTCIDAKILDIFYNVTYFQKGKFAYAFLIDDKGRTISHPRMPTPSKDKDFLIHISTLEKEATSNGIVGSMLKGESGMRSLYVTRAMSGGNSYGQYKDAQIVTATYHWQQVPHSYYSICVVLTSDDTDVRVDMKDPQVMASTKYNHHRTLEEDVNHLKECQHQGLLASKDESTVIFDGNALQKLEITSRYRDQVLSYKQYFQTGENLQDTFRQGTREWVYLGGLADDEWQKDDKYKGMIYWRHLALRSGVSRIFPGTQFNDKYIPIAMPWYKEAIESPGRVVLTKFHTPTRNVVVLSRALSVGTPYRKPVGVIAGEFRPNFFYQLLTDTYSNCGNEDTRCFIVDGRGYILAHKNMDPEDQVHILHMEPQIGKHLVKGGYLKQTACLDIEAFKTQKAWRMSLEDFILEGPSFEIHTVFGTNIYIGIALGKAPQQIMPTSKSVGAEINCGSEGHPVCYDRLQFDYCNNTFSRDDQRKASITCASPKIVYPLPVTGEPVSNDTKSCFPIECNLIKIETHCLRYIDCQWCYELESNSQEKVCRGLEHCAGSAPPRRNLLLKILLPLIALLAIGMIVVAVFLVRKGWCSRFSCWNHPEKTIEPYYKDDIKVEEPEPRKNRYINQAQRPPVQIPVAQNVEGGQDNMAYSPNSDERVLPFVPESNGDLACNIVIPNNPRAEQQDLPQAFPRPAPEPTTKPEPGPKPRVVNAPSPPPPIPKAPPKKKDQSIAAAPPEKDRYVNHQAEVLRSDNTNSHEDLDLSLPDMKRRSDYGDYLQQRLGRPPAPHPNPSRGLHSEDEYSTIYDLAKAPAAQAAAKYVPPPLVAVIKKSDSGFQSEQDSNKTDDTGVKHV